MIVPEALERYARENSSPESELFQELAEVTYARMDHPGMQVGHVQGTFLRVITAAIGARRALEIGTFTGYSALSIASGMPEDGKLITCDQDPEATRIAQTFWARSGHGHKIELRLGKALDTLKTLEGPFDLTFIDADKENNRAYWDACVPLLRPGGIILVDNVLRNGNILEPKTELDWVVADFNTYVRNDTRVEAVVLTIRDGVTLARKLG